MKIDVYCGPKSESLFEQLAAQDPVVKARHYAVIRASDARWCTFQWLTDAMLWLLTFIHGIVGNYGIAIIILVIIVRLILHPVTKRGQVSMMKMQKAQASIKPKLDALQEKYKNDKQKLQEEQMKLYREEGINPMGSILGCLPMGLQMPIWIALWTTLNTNVDMRHMPFFWWIHDLSSPDALIPFGTSYDVPLIGTLMGPISAFNLLPIIMTITMYAQQKLMQKFTKPVTPAQPKLDKDGNPIADPQAQMQKMMGFMMVFFGFIFYNFPSGLNLYILTSNLLGMAEQYHIKKQIREQDEKGGFEPKKKPSDTGGKPSLLARYYAALAKKAEEARLEQSGKSHQRTAKRGKRDKTKSRA
jgi:YidC/Oxa1 family membrane protein insertase